MTLILSQDWYYLVMAAAGGLVAAGFVIWVVVRQVHPLILAGVLVAAVGWTGFAWSMNLQRPTVGSTMAGKADMVKDWERQLVEWEADPDRWVRHLWPMFLIVGLSGFAIIGYAWDCYIDGEGIFDPRNRKGTA